MGRLQGRGNLGEGEKGKAVYQVMKWERVNTNTIESQKMRTII